jgi:glutamate 5-kinase
MKTKLKAAKIVNKAGIPMVIGPAYKNNIISKMVKMIENEEKYNIGTTFIPGEKKCRREKYN